MAGTWKQDFCKRVTKVNYKRSKDKDGKNKIITEYLPTDGYNMPVLLLGNKFDIVRIGIVYPHFLNIFFLMFVCLFVFLFICQDSRSNGRRISRR